MLHENDIDYPVAKALASRLIAERAFEPIGEEAFARAAEVLKACGRVICCPDHFGAMNERNRILAELGADRLCGPEDI